MVIEMTDSTDHTKPAPDGTACQFELTGGATCLDFANTVDNRPTAALEQLEIYGDLVRWAEQAEVISAGQADVLRAEAARRPEAARAALAGARVLREAIYTVFSAVAAGREAPAEPLALLNAALPPSLARLRLAVPAGGSAAGTPFTWHWDLDDHALDGLLGPLVESAADLLTSPNLARVRECEADNCGWLFIDRSRNRSRRWCDMAVCGNRAKARRYQARTRAVVFPSPETGGGSSGV